MERADSAIKVSVITINLNNKSGLEKTISSVINQSFRDFEYIIIDGDSNDGSKDVISKFSKNIDNFISEKDKGIYDAMNKGVMKAKGEYLLFLNSGDYFYNDNVVETLFSHNPTTDLAYGNQSLIGREVKKYPAVLPFAFFFSDTLPHQATFIKRDLFAKVGLYNLKYSIASDYDFFLRALFLHQCSYKYYDVTVVYFDMTGLSNQHSYKIPGEFEEIRQSLFPNFHYEFRSLLEQSRRLSSIENSKWYRVLRRIKRVMLPNNIIRIPAVIP